MGESDSVSKNSPETRVTVLRKSHRVAFRHFEEMKEDVSNRKQEKKTLFKVIE